MLSTTWARKRPAGMLDSSAAETGMTRVPEPSLRELLSLPQLQLQSMDPRYVSQGPRWSTACAKVSLLPSPSISFSMFQLLFLPDFKPAPSQKLILQPPRRMFSYRPKLRSRACWIPMISLCVCSIFSAVWRSRTLRAFLLLLLAR